MEEQGRKRRGITAEEKLDIFLEVQKGNITKALCGEKIGTLIWAGC